MDADIQVGRLSVNGKLSGKVQASESIELLARSRVFATLCAPVVKVEVIGASSGGRSSSTTSRATST